MKMLKFNDGVKPTTGDLNNIHGFTEDGIRTLLAAIGGANSKLLFEGYAPDASESGGVLTITIPSQHFAVDGAVVAVAEDTTNITVVADLRVGCYLVLSKEPVEEIRNFLTLNPDNVLVQQDALTTVHVVDAGRVEYTTIDDLNGVVPEPVLGVLDVGFIWLGTVDYTFSGSIVDVTVNSTDVYTIPPAAAGAVTTHASSHLPLGNDPLQVADLDGGEPGGSSVGFMPNGALTAALGGIQNIENDPLAPFITVVTAGDNAANGDGTIDEKTVTIGLLFDNSLTLRSSGNNTQLGVAFSAPGATNGNTYKAAHSNHKHALVDTGILYQSFTFDIDTSFSGFGEISGPYTVTSAQSGGTGGSGEVGSIIAIHARWIPPNLTGNNAAYSVDAPFSVVHPSGALPGTVGVRPIVKNANQFYLEIGELGFAYLTSRTIAHMNTFMNPNWALGNYATYGKLQVDVIALRVESFTAGTTNNTL